MFALVFVPIAVLGILLFETRYEPAGYQSVRSVVELREKSLLGHSTVFLGFAELLATSDSALIERGVELYRERFADVGLFENEVYDDVPEGLGELGRADGRLSGVSER